MASITNGQFHPKNPDLFLTSSLDSTMRQWNIQAKRYGMESNLPHQDVFKLKDERGVKTGITTCSYDHKGDVILAGCLDGSIQVWDVRATSSQRPQAVIRNAHNPNKGQITCLKPMRAQYNFLSRATQDENFAEDSDASMKLWDLRMVKKAGTEAVWSWRH